MVDCIIMYTAAADYKWRDHWLDNWQDWEDAWGVLSVNCICQRRIYKGIRNSNALNHRATRRSVMLQESLQFTFIQTYLLLIVTIRRFRSWMENLTSKNKGERKDTGKNFKIGHMAWHKTFWVTKKWILIFLMPRDRLSSRFHLYGNVKKIMGRP
jgi:hypothetical protein